MTFRATAAAGLWICTAVLGISAAAAQDQAAVGSATAVTAADKPIKLHARHVARPHHAVRHVAKASHKPAETKPAETAQADPAKADPANTDAANTDAASANTATDQPGNGMSPAVANANAQWPTTDAPPANTYNVSDKAGTMLSQIGAKPEQPATATPAPAPDGNSDSSQVVASDQLNDLDRAASPDDGKPPLTLARATLDTPTATDSESASADSNSPWTQTSVIGKVFIALGGVLTLASAARMFIA